MVGGHGGWTRVPGAHGLCAPWASNNVAMLGRGVDVVRIGMYVVVMNNGGTDMLTNETAIAYVIRVLAADGDAFHATGLVWAEQLDGVDLVRVQVQARQEGSMHLFDVWVAGEELYGEY